MVDGAFRHPKLAAGRPFRQASRLAGLCLAGRFWLRPPADARLGGRPWLSALARLRGLAVAAVSWRAVRLGLALCRRPCGAAPSCRGFLPPPRGGRASISGTASSSVIVLGRLVGGQRRVDAVVADIGAVAAALRPPARLCPDARRVLAPGRRRAALRGPWAFFSAISVTARLRPTVSTSSPRLEIGVGLAVLDIGAEAADAGDDRLAALGMQADLARQRRAASARARDRSSAASALRQAGALRLLAVSPLRRAARRGRSGRSARVTSRPLSGSLPSFRVPLVGRLPPCRPRTGGCSGTRDSSSSR